MTRLPPRPWRLGETHEYMAMVVDADGNEILHVTCPNSRLLKRPLVPDIVETVISIVNLMSSRW